MPLTLQQLQNTVAQQANSIWTPLLAKQAGFRSVHGRNLQLLWTSSVAPADGAEADPDGWETTTTELPEVHTEDWAIALPQISRRPLHGRFRVDVYGGPLGQGFALAAQFRWAGVLWEMQLHDGPDQGWGYGWREVAEVAP